MGKMIQACALGVFVVTLGSGAYAQTSVTTTSGPKGDSKEETRTLLDTHPAIGGYGGLEVRSSPVMGTTSALVGGQGGVILGHRFVLGGAGYGLATPIEAPPVLQTAGVSNRLGFGYGGVRLAYVLVPRALVHTVFGVLVGGGAATWETDTVGKTRNDAFFVVEPQFEIEVNVHRLVRLAGTGSYRFVRGLQTAGLSDGDFRGASFGGILKIGLF